MDKKGKYVVVMSPENNPTNLMCIGEYTNEMEAFGRVLQFATSGAYEYGRVDDLVISIPKIMNGDDVRCEVRSKDGNNEKGYNYYVMYCEEG